MLESPMLRIRTGAAFALVVGTLVTATPWPVSAQEQPQPPPSAEEPAPSPEDAPASPRHPYPLRMINGLESMRADATKIAVYRGSATDNSGQGLIEVERTLVLDVQKTGLLGRDDVATPDDVTALRNELAPDAAMPNGFRASHGAGGDGASQPARGWYYVVYLGAPGRPASAILTRQLSSMRTDRPGDARPPLGYPFRRHSPTAFFYEPKTGFRPMICAGWPQPTCNWTRMEDDAETFAVLKNGTATEPTEISCEDWLPGTGRILKLQAVLTSVGGRGGAYLKPIKEYPGEILAGWVNRDGDKSVTFLEIGTTSQRKLNFRVDPGVRLDLYAIGFTILQPT